MRAGEEGKACFVARGERRTLERLHPTFDDLIFRWLVSKKPIRCSLHATLHERRVRILEGARRDPIATEAWFVTTVNRIFTADSDDEDDD